MDDTETENRSAVITATEIGNSSFRETATTNSNGYYAFDRVFKDGFVYNISLDSIPQGYDLPSSKKPVQIRITGANASVNQIST